MPHRGTQNAVQNLETERNQCPKDYTMTTILTTLLTIISLNAHAIDHNGNYEERVATLTKQIFEEDPTATKLSTSEQCVALKREISRRQGFTVVIPACVALKLDEYTD